MDELHRPTFATMRKLVWHQMKAHPRDSQAELEDRVKWVCAKLGFAYNSESVRKAVDCVLFLERGKRGRVA